MNGWKVTCRFIGEGKSFVAEINQVVYERFVETTNTFDACFHSTGLFIDETYSGQKLVVIMEREIKLILLDFLKKTPSFSYVVENGLPYAAFTFFRANDWTRDDPNYRYRFLGAYKDQHSDHMLWAGNKFFCREDYHAGSYVHQYLSGDHATSNHGQVRSHQGDAGALLLGHRDADGQPMEGGLMIDIPDKANSLMSRMKNNLPIKAYISSSLANELTEKSPGVVIPRRCDVVDVIYAGDVGGILCRLDIDSKDPHLLSITLLSFNHNHPLAREIDAYQRHRIKKIKRQPTYH